MTEKEVQHATVFDTDQQQLGDVYAKALLGFAQTAGNVDSLVDELNGVVDAVNQLPTLKDALESPRVAVEAKESLLEKAFGGRVSKDLLNFLKVVGRKGRFDCLNAVKSSTKKLYDEMSGSVEATITTAEQVDTKVQSDVASKLESLLGRKVQLESKIDPGIIGGMVIRVGDTVYDGSVVSQLNQVRTKAVKRATDAIRSSMEKFTSD